MQDAARLSLQMYSESSSSSSSYAASSRTLRLWVISLEGEVLYAFLSAATFAGRVDNEVYSVDFGWLALLSQG